MRNILIGYIIVIITLVGSEILGSQLFTKKTEIPRKLVHVFGGLAAISLVFLTSFHQIFIIALICTLIMLIITRYKLLGNLYPVDRKSYGEILFPLGVGLSALFAGTIASYLFAMSALSFADSFAALIGSRYAKKKYEVFGHQKSLLGSSMVFLIMFISGAVLLARRGGLGAENVIIVGVISVIGAIIEAFSTNGLDNLLLPLLATFLWRFFVGY